MPTYRQILIKALNIALTHRSLWFFGFFTALFGAGGEIELLLQSSSLGENQGVIVSFFAGFFEGGFFNAATLSGLFNLMLSQPFSFLIFLFLLTLVLAAMVLVVWLLIVSQVALVNGALLVLKNQSVSWSESFKVGMANFWPIFFINTLLKVISWGLLAVLAALTVLNFSGLTPLFVFGFMLFVWLILFLSFITKYAILFIVTKKQQAGQAVKGALNLFSKNWLLSLEVAVTLFVIYWLVNSAFLVLFREVMAYVLFQRPGAIGGYIFFSFVIFAFLQMLLAVFHWTSWVIVFQILNNKQLAFNSRLVDGFKKIFG